MVLNIKGKIAKIYYYIWDNSEVGFFTKFVVVINHDIAFNSLCTYMSLCQHSKVSTNG